MTVLCTIYAVWRLLLKGTEFDPYKTVTSDNNVINTEGVP